MAKIGPIRFQIVEGEPVRVGAYTLTPLVRQVSFERRVGHIGPQRVAGWGTGVAWLKPVAVIEEGPDGRRRVPIPDPTSAALWAMRAAAVLGVALVLLGSWALRRKAG
jgi:hypothetical protein